MQLERLQKKRLIEKTGARGLRAVMEETMLDMMYELPSQKDIEEVVINEEVVANGEKPHDGLRQKETGQLALWAQIKLLYPFSL